MVYERVFLAIILDVVFLASSGKNFGHYLQVVLPGMVVGMVCLVDFLRRSSIQDFSSRSLKVAVLAVVVIVYLSGILEIATKELLSMEELKAFFAPPGPMVYQPTELEQYIIDHSSPSDQVLIWAGHPDMNFVTQRHSSTKYIFILHLFAPTPYGPNGYNEFLGEMKADPPALIIAQPASYAGIPYFANPSDPLCNDCDPLMRQGLADFNQFVATRYVLNYSIWDWVVYERVH